MTTGVSTAPAPRLGHRAAIALAVIGILSVVAWLALTRTVGVDTLATTADLRRTQAADLAVALTRVGSAGPDVDVEATIATPTFFNLTGQSDVGQRLGADQSVMFVITESTHLGQLAPALDVTLRVDERTYAPANPNILADAVHHRTSAISFPGVPPSSLDDDHQIELILPASAAGMGDTLTWRTPLDYPRSVQGLGLSGLGLLLPLAAGLLAAISPCLLQLTGFFVPTLAGIAVDPANVQDGRVNRRAVLPIAGIFVLGFTIPYTLGGAAIGALGGRLAASGWISPTGPIAIGAGVVMIAMAVLVARRARAPLACHLPLPGTLQRSRRLPVVEAFVSGFAIATGCLACFGGAIFAVLIVYTGVLGSAWLGGLAMFVFSLGIAVPFLLAALSLSRVEPLLGFLSRAQPAVGMVMATIMLLFGLSMATGNFHVVSGWLARILPLG